MAGGRDLTTLDSLTDDAVGTISSADIVKTLGLEGNLAELVINNFKHVSDNDKKAIRQLAGHLKALKNKIKDIEEGGATSEEPTELLKKIKSLNGRILQRKITSALLKEEARIETEQAQREAEQAKEAQREADQAKTQALREAAQATTTAQREAAQANAQKTSALAAKNQAETAKKQAEAVVRLTKQSLDKTNELAEVEGAATGAAAGAGQTKYYEKYLKYKNKYLQLQKTN